jgi:N-acetylglutamate synthase-like GNAT family acetyltransferase
MNSNDLNILDFHPDMATLFDVINRRWIEQMFVVEDIDDKVLKDPQKYIINQGGKIWFVQSAQFGVIGTCALLNKGDGCFELTKMGVLENVRGLKVGEKLLEHIIHYCKTSNLPYVFLLTNQKCEAAIHLYKKLGFEHDQATMTKFGASYLRCNVAMRLFV